MSPAKFREVGHSLVDSIADFLGGLPEARTASKLLPDAIRAKVGKRALPEKGADIAPVIEKFSRLFFEQSTHNGSPRFFGYITSSAAPVSALADLLAAAVNPELWRVGAVADRHRGRERDRSAGSRSSWVCPANGTASW